jgi:uncharacterized LabA/DUF88 family protein
LANYLFIDGAYLRARLTYIAKLFSIDNLDFDYRAFSHSTGAQKAFYYDCLPARGPNERGDDYEKRVEPQRNSFKAIKSLPGYHVFLGEAVHSGGDIVQKGVDILIAVHMLTHSFRGVIDRAVLFAGDRDFTPLVLALVQQGIYVTVGYHPKSISEELLDAADDRLEYDTCKLWNFATPQFKRRFPAPFVSNLILENYPATEHSVIRSGGYQDEEVKIYKARNTCEIYLPVADDYATNFYYSISHPDEKVIMKILEERNIAVSW